MTQLHAPSACTHPHANHRTNTPTQHSTTQTPTGHQAVNCYNVHLTTHTHHTSPQVNDGDRHHLTHQLVPTTSTQKPSSSTMPLGSKRPNHPTPEWTTMPSHTQPQKRQDLKPSPSKMTRTTHNDPNTLTALKHKLSTDQSKYTNAFVAPRGPALDHPAAPMLLEFATAGCNATNNDRWSMEPLEAVIAKGNHPSALLLEPVAQLCAETLEKILQGYAWLITWDNIKHDPPLKLKISPIAAIPHKSRGYQMILDLSYGFTINGIRHPSA